MVKTWARHKTTEAVLNNGWQMVGGWRLLNNGWHMVGSWWRLAVGSSRLAVGGWWRLAVGGWWSLGAVLLGCR